MRRNRFYKKIIYVTLALTASVSMGWMPVSANEALIELAAETKASDLSVSERNDTDLWERIDVAESAGTIVEEASSEEERSFTKDAFEEKECLSAEEVSEKEEMPAEEEIRAAEGETPVEEDVSAAEGETLAEEEVPVAEEETPAAEEVPFIEETSVEEESSATERAYMEDAAAEESPAEEERLTDGVPEDEEAPELFDQAAPKNGFVETNGIWRWYVDDQLQTSLTGLVKGTINGEKGWYYIVNGVYTKKNGLVRRADHSLKDWFYIQDGVFTKKNGIARKADGSSPIWYYVQNGRFVRRSGITRKADGSSPVWYYVQNGRFVRRSGITRKADGSSPVWYYVQNGRFLRTDTVARKADGSSSVNYHVANGRFYRITGWKKYQGNWYYLYKGRAVTGSHSFSGATYLFNSYGVCAEPYPYAAASDLAHSINRQSGGTLWSAFLNAASGTFVDLWTYNVGQDILPAYGAVYKFLNNRGDCMYMASAFYYLAKDLGYDAHIIDGYVLLSNGRRNSGHNWVEIDINGAVHVYDPQVYNQYPGVGYDFVYGQRGTLRYVDYHRIN